MVSITKSDHPEKKHFRGFLVRARSIFEFSDWAFQLKYNIDNWSKSDVNIDIFVAMLIILVVDIKNKKSKNVSQISQN